MEPESSAFAWRSFMLDCSRHIHSVQFLQRVVDLLQRMEMNTLHLHLTDDQGWRIPVDAYPKLVSAGSRIQRGPAHEGSYSRDEIRFLVDYAGERGIQIVPEIDIPGHTFAAVTSYPDLCCTGSPVWNEGHQKDVLCPGKESTFDFIDTVLEEVAELFPSAYVHIGGDEAPTDRWKACPACRSRMIDEGCEHVDELHGYLVQRAFAKLNELGKQVIGWEEVLNGNPPREMIVQWWRHRTHGDRAARDAMTRGHRVIASPNSFTYLSFPTTPDRNFSASRTSDLKKVYTADYARALSEFATGVPGELMGIECCCWTEYLSEEMIEPMIFPRILACADIMRASPAAPDYEAFVATLPAIEKSVRR